jgi:Flp pilus assembly protein TadG
MIRIFADRRDRAMSRTARRFRRNRDGAAAVEFALITPIMVAMIFGVIDVSNGVSLNWRLTQLARTLTDLTARAANQVTPADLNTIFAASNAVLTPFNGAPPVMEISSVVIDAGRVARVCWSNRSVNGVVGPGRPRGDIVTLPNADLAVPNTSLIMAEASVSYQTGFGPLIDALFPPPPMQPRATINMRAGPYYFRPRQGTASPNAEQIVRVGTPVC